MNYELKCDMDHKGEKARYYIRGEKPSTYITDNMTYAQITLVARSLKQLGHSVHRVLKEV